MRHKIIERKVDPQLWNNPIPVNPQEVPEFGREDYQERIARLWAMPQAGEYDTIVVYGDREHFSNVEYFTGYDARWEETLLILPRHGVPSILVGNEGIGYVKKVPIEVNVEFYQTFSLMGQPNDKSPMLREILKRRIRAGNRKIGIIGFKAYPASRHTIKGLVTDVPHYIIETLCQAVPSRCLENATLLMADCQYGLKHRLSPKEIVVFEAAGTRISRGVLNCLRNLKPGMTELEASCHCGFDGSPGNMHPNINFGERNVALGLNSPTEWERLAYGSPIGVGYGLRGSLVHKCGMYIRDRLDLAREKKGYIDDFLVPYFDSVVSWHEEMKAGACCGDVYGMVDRELGLEKFGCTLNPGHLTHTDEWTNSPFSRGSRVTVESGMAFQCDYTVTWNKPFMSAHVEDGLVIAEEGLRREVARLSPGCWERIQKRREFVLEELGIGLPQDILPFSDLCCVCFPYMADLNTVLALG